MKTLLIILHLITLTGLSNDNPLHGSEKSCLQMTVIPRSGQETLKNAKVTLMLGNHVLFTILHPNAVRGYNFVLARDTQYTIVIECDGKLQRKIAIDTRIPEKEFSLGVFRFEALVEMPPVDAGFDDDYTDFPVAMIEYDPKKGLFLPRKKYTENIKFMLTEEKPVIVQRAKDGDEQ